MAKPRAPTGYFTRGKVRPVHARTGLSRLRIPDYPPTGGVIAGPGPRYTRVLEGGLHPQTLGPSQQEPVQTAEQALTHAQKEHLSSFSGMNPQEQYSHLVGFHAFQESPPTHKVLVRFTHGIPEYEDRPVAGAGESYNARHLMFHRTNLAERATSRSR